MSKCVESVLVGGEDVEIIIVDDGSTDGTAKLADEYAQKYPTIIKAVHKENGGHGDAVNVGIANATGYYFKVVDSDDWLSEEPLKKVLETLKKVIADREADDTKPELDLLLANYVYDKVGRRKKRVMRYTGALKEDEILTWETSKIKFRKYQYVLMHSIIYRTKLLKESKLVLPKHTFYVDNIFAFVPMMNVKTLMYMNVDLYRYYIGRDGQSVNEQTMVKRIDQQIFINKEIINYFTKNCDGLNPQLYRFLFQYMDMMMCVSSVICIVGNTKEILEKKRNLWAYLKKKDAGLYKKLRRTLLGVTMNLPGRVGRSFSKTGYHIVQKLFGFN
jgi:glycosyltransferase involved in cell wall biosynthesis